MYSFRSFLNSDTPQLVGVWQSQPPERGLRRPMSTAVFDQLLLAKPYFDRQGLIVAQRDGEVVGFVHAGFGPTEEGDAICTELGVTCMLLVQPEEAESTLAADLLGQSEDYLRRRGAQVLYAGAIRPLNPFYQGLYGGSELPGVLASDTERQAFYRSQGYREVDRTVILRCDLAQFRCPVNRQVIQWRRQTEVSSQDEPDCRTWWETWTVGLLERVRYCAYDKQSGKPLATANIWNMDQISSACLPRLAGLTDLEVVESVRRSGLGTCLLSELFGQLRSFGTETVEAQTMVHNAAALALYRKLGFKEVDQGVVFRKE